MHALGSFLLVYVIGGLTFVPLCLVAVAACLYYASPLHAPPDADTDDLADATPPPSLPDDFKVRATEPDVAAAYFAVCREYVPGGVNGKPPERTTPAGTVVGVESPSVYQTMYRSLFDRNKNQSPSMEGAKGNKSQKKARNVFFVVLRHGHLILFDDSEQVEVRYVISLAHRVVDVYAGGDQIQEGELWIKRNCIRLRRTQDAVASEAESRPFYLFSENCSDKEDFYFALLRNQERQTGMPISPPLQFDQPHIIKLVQQLHATEENLQTRWINALIGRLFLALYKTPNVEEFIRMKITKKISRVAKPAFIQSITIQRIVMGDSGPMITNPKLRELTLDGDLTAEADIKYNGNFRLEIAAVARIDLGARFKARYVNMVLAGILKKLEGHVLIRVKPPPSNRLWLTFETPPKMEMAIEPIVSSRQITYGMILRAIESRIREVIAETLVLPNWDDMPFFDTMSQPLRGGIWEDATKAPVSPDTAHEGTVDDASIDDGSTLNEEPAPSQFVRKDEKTMSMPNLGDPDTSSLKSRKSVKSVMSVNATSDTATTSGAEIRTSPSKPKSMRSGSFASIARPVVAQDIATVEALKSPNQQQHDAISAMKDISARSLPNSPVESPVGSPANPPGPLTDGSHETPKKETPKEKEQSAGRTVDEESITDLFGETVYSHTEPVLIRPERTTTTNSENSSLYSHNDSIRSEASSKSQSRKTSLSEKRQMLNMLSNTATSAAKKWFASRQQQQPQHQHQDQQHQEHGPTTPSRPSPSFPSPAPSGTPALSSSPSKEAPSENEQVPGSATKPSEHSPPGSTTPQPPPRESRSTSVSGPMGRGQPLPPPGMPLPPPSKSESKWAQAAHASLLNLTKRKPVPGGSSHAPSPSQSSIPSTPQTEQHHNHQQQQQPGTPGTPSELQPSLTAPPAHPHQHPVIDPAMMNSIVAPPQAAAVAANRDDPHWRAASSRGNSVSHGHGHPNPLASPKTEKEREERERQRDIEDFLSSGAPASASASLAAATAPVSGSGTVSATVSGTVSGTASASASTPASVSPTPPPLPPRKPRAATTASSSSSSSLTSSAVVGPGSGGEAAQQQQQQSQPQSQAQSSQHQRGKSSSVGSNTTNNGGNGNNNGGPLSPSATRNGRRRRSTRSGPADADNDPEHVLVIKAPVASDASAPPTPEGVDERGVERRFAPSQAPAPAGLKKHDATSGGGGGVKKTGGGKQTTDDADDVGMEGDDEDEKLAGSVFSLELDDEGTTATGEGGGGSGSGNGNGNGNGVGRR